MREPKQVQVAFANELNTEVSISWVDFEGSEHSSGAVGPLSRHVLQSFPGHAFRVRAPTGQLLQEAIVSRTAEKGALIDVLPCGAYTESVPKKTHDMPKTMPHVERPSKSEVPPPPRAAGPAPDRRTPFLWAFLVAAVVAHVWPQARDFVRVRQERLRADKEAASVLAALATRRPQASMMAGDDDDISGDSSNGSNISVGKNDSKNLRRRALAAATETTASRVQLSGTGNNGRSARSNDTRRSSTSSTTSTNSGRSQVHPTSRARSGREEAFARADLSLKRLQEQQRTAAAEASAARQRASAEAAEASRARAAALPGARQLAEQNQAFVEALQHDRSATAQKEAEASEEAAAKARAAAALEARESAEAARRDHIAGMVASLPDEPPSKITQTTGGASSNSSEPTGVPPEQVCCAVKVRLPHGRSSMRRFPASNTTLRQVAWWALHEAASGGSGKGSSSSNSEAVGLPPQSYELCTVHPRKVLVTHAELEGDACGDSGSSNSPGDATVKVRVICMSNKIDSNHQQHQQPCDLELNLPATASVADAKTAIATATAQQLETSGGFQAPEVAQRLVFGGRVLADVELLGNLARSPSRPAAGADAAFVAAPALTLILTVNPKLLVSAQHDSADGNGNRRRSSSSSSSRASNMPASSASTAEIEEDRAQGLDSTLEVLGFVPSVLLVFAALDSEE